MKIQPFIDCLGFPVHVLPVCPWVTPICKRHWQSTFFKEEWRNISIDPSLLWLLSEHSLIPLQDSRTLKTRRSLTCQTFAENAESWLIERLRRGLLCFGLRPCDTCAFSFMFTFYYLLRWNSILIHISLPQSSSNQLLRATAHAGCTDVWSIM